MKSKTACIAPWIHLHTYPNGLVYPCCLTPNNFPIGDLRENTLAEIWNNDKVKTLRKDLLDGKQPQSCNLCFKHEKHNKHSFRNHLNTTFKHHMHKLAETNKDGSFDNSEIVYWDFRFSNICNMKCRTCGPQLSTGWYDDTKKLYGKLPDDVPNEKIKDILWEQISSLFDVVEDIYFAGGEPLIMEEHYKILKTLDEQKKYKVRLRYNTNFSQLKYKKLNILEIWPKFDFVEVGASLDGYGKHAEYIRRGTVWEDIEKNIKNQKIFAPNIKFFINCTVGVLNAHHLVDFHKYAVENKLIDSYKNFNLNFVHSPDCFSIQILPQSHKKQLAKIYKKHSKFLRANGFDDIANQFNSLLSFMMEEDKTFLLEDFKNRIQSVDIIRNESFTDTFPELKDLFT